MRNEAAPTEVGNQYAAAHAMHYKTKDLDEALGLYEGVMAAYPDSPEAEYSRSQIQNIAKSVVPKEELVAAQVTVAREHLKFEGPPEA
ncbi:hypothetical protein AAU61_07395 [Desulfocarbo indianensis]|nr:hypothetical protein AAU61_07395 [Desulfocarbo indianensis]